MSKERETLITDLEINAVDGFFYITQKHQSEIRELLTQKREPLSDEEIDIGFQTDTGNYIDETSFIAGVIFAEKAHGITGGEE